MYPLFINSHQVCCFGPGPNDVQTYTVEFNKVYLVPLYIKWLLVLCTYIEINSL